MIIREFKGKKPVIDESSFVAETAAVIGDVKIGKDCSIWYSAVIRADGNSIEIGDRVSVQDCCCIHITTESEFKSYEYKTEPTIPYAKRGAVKIGNDVIIGHNATVHACTIGDHCLIGMGSTLLDGAVIGDNAVVAAGAVVLGGTVIGPYELWGGIPAKLITTLRPEAITKLVDADVVIYKDLVEEYNKQ